MTTTTFAPTARVNVAINRLTHAGTAPLGRPEGYTTEAWKALALATLMQAGNDGTMARQIAGYQLNGGAGPFALVQAAEMLCQMANRYRSARWSGRQLPRLADAYFPERQPAPGDDGRGLLWSQSVTPLSLLCEAHDAVARTELDAVGGAKLAEALAAVMEGLIPLSSRYNSIPPGMENQSGAYGYTPAEYLLDLAAMCVLPLADVFNAATGTGAPEFKRAARSAILHANSAPPVPI